MKRISPGDAVTRIWRAALFFTFSAMLIVRSVPTTEQKNAGGLRLSKPIETPTSVQLSWTGGSADATYSIYAKKLGEPTLGWERIALGLSGVSGVFFWHRFTLDSGWAYRIQAEVPE